MSAHIKTEKLFFVRKFFVVAPSRRRALPRRCGSRCLIEQRNLPSQPVPLRCNRRAHCVFDAAKQFGAVPANKIKRARLYQALQHLAVSDAWVESTAEILQRNEVASLFAFANDTFHGGFADVFDGGKTITNA